MKAIALADFGRGLGWVLGLRAPVASLLIRGTMAVALRRQGQLFVASAPSGPL
jgi:hypothetical protein